MQNPVETEVKIRVAGDAIRERLPSLGFVVSAARVFEANTLYDRQGELRNRGEILRLREAADHFVITFKGPGQPGTYKQREEIETSVGSAQIAANILQRLGYARVFRYEKFRTEFKRSEEEHRVVTLDETPIGNFLELEGPGDWIDATAQQLGFSREDYILDSYGKLYLADCQRRGVEPAHMVFSS